MDDLNTSLKQYKDQISMVNQALETTVEVSERESLLSLQNDLSQLIQLTQESIDTMTNKSSEVTVEAPQQEKTELDDEYALFMQEMEKTGAYENNEKSESNKDAQVDNNTDSDIEDELASLQGMKCSVYHTPKWGGQPTLHNAMVSAVEPRGEDDRFNDLQVRVLFTHPTQPEMLPCPFYLDGECRFTDQQCRYSHGAITPLSNLKEAIEPKFDALKPGTRILMKLKPPDDEDISLTKKSSEKYHLWHRAVVTSVDADNKTCSARLERGHGAGEGRAAGRGEYDVRVDEIFPLEDADTADDSSDDSLSDTEYPETKSMRTETDHRDLIVERSLQYNGPAMGEWEKHTRGMGSKLMLAMGYVPGTGLGAAGEGRLLPVEATVVPLGKSLDHCMQLNEKANGDPNKVEQRLKRLQKKEEERNRRAYEREKERERRNVFNFLNRTIGDTEQESVVIPSVDVKQTSSKDLNIEHFKINEDQRKIEREIMKLKNSLQRHATGTSLHRSLSAQVAEKNRELEVLRSRERQISKEQKQRKDKAKMTVF